MKNKKNILTYDGAGFGFIAAQAANVLGKTLYVISKQTEKELYEQENLKVFNNFKDYDIDIVNVPFEEKELYNDLLWDIIADHRAKTLSKDFWKIAPSKKLRLKDTTGLPTFEGLKGKKNILVTPQKLVSDVEFGKTAAEQSLDLSVFYPLKGLDYHSVLGQHFDRIKDNDKVIALAEKFNMYVPGREEHPETYGVRGIPHKMYYLMDAQLDGAIGILGTDAWRLLFCFPEKFQFRSYRKGLEDFTMIAEQFRNYGYPIFGSEFDETTNMQALSADMFAKLQEHVK